MTKSLFYKKEIETLKKRQSKPVLTNRISYFEHQIVVLHVKVTGLYTLCGILLGLNLSMLGISGNIGGWENSIRDYLLIMASALNIIVVLLNFSTMHYKSPFQDMELDSPEINKSIENFIIKRNKMTFKVKLSHNILLTAIILIGIAFIVHFISILE
ncbi:MAG: hypothetical protein ACTSRZ_10530 [Promethearchaeota archaeon]